MCGPSSSVFTEQLESSKLTTIGENPSSCSSSSVSPYEASAINGQASVCSEPLQMIEQVHLVCSQSDTQIDSLQKINDSDPDPHTRDEVEQMQ